MASPPLDVIRLARVNHTHIDTLSRPDPSFPAQPNEQLLPDASQWLRHTTTTEPGGFGPQIAQLPADIAALSGAIQRLLVHTDCLALYGLDARSMTNISRATLPVQERLHRLSDTGHLDLAEGRPPTGRQVGTCRDFALFLCSFLRVHHTPARVRCGFASYFGAGWWDHWICEVWSAEAKAWLRADAELDEVMCAACHITFDPLNMPQGTFLTAPEAWAGCRAGPLSPDEFGHGEHRGLWFIGMNVARDSLSLNGQEMSPWDRWREAGPAFRHLSADQRLRIDDLARDPERLPDPLTPPWLASRSEPQNPH